jgi:hypothetical protein
LAKLLLPLLSLLSSFPSTGPLPLLFGNPSPLFLTVLTSEHNCFPLVQKGIAEELNKILLKEVRMSRQLGLLSLRSASADIFSSVPVVEGPVYYVSTGQELG